ncbi:MAG: subclass B3 metallo-beta-lactamase [Terriglobales bacterium]
MKFPLCFLLLFGLPLVAQYTPATPGQNDPVEPFRIIGNIYYVGASEVTSYLITSPEGDILLDGGFPETALVIERNIQKLGFKLTDVKALISTHAHFDHAGGLAELKRATGAKFYASAADQPLLAAGGKGDFAFGDRLLFPAVIADETVKDGQVLRAGSAAMQAHLTPGHTKGCTTWTADVIENGAKHTAVFVCSISMPGGYKLVNNAKYPQIAEDYKRTYQKLQALHPDVFLGSHASFYDLKTKRAKQLKGSAPNPFIDPTGYQAFVADNEKTFEAELKKQQRKVAAVVTK